MNLKEIFIILGMANEHEHISVQQISTATEYDTKTVRKRLKWGLKKQMISGTLDDDLFVRRHRMRKLHIEYTYWLENPEEYSWERFQF